MADDLVHGKGPAGALKRPRFEATDYLTASDLAVEQAWRRQRLRRHNRHLHGWGVVCGLRAVPAGDPSRPWAVFVCPGYAIGPYGDEIIVTCRATTDLRDWLWSRPAGVARAYVAIEPAAKTRSPGTRTPGCGCACGCSEGFEHDTRVTDGWRIQVVWAVQPDVKVSFDLCSDLPTCPPCPDVPYVLLAAVTLPADEGITIGRAAIDLSVRRIV